MDWNESDVRRNRDYFQWKLHAIKQRADVVKAIEQGPFDFVLLDTRGREAFAFGHITGGRRSNAPLLLVWARYSLPPCGSLPSLGAPVPDEPTNSRRPSANVSSRPLPLSEPSLARKPSTRISLPSGSEFFVKPRR